MHYLVHLSFGAKRIGVPTITINKPLQNQIGFEGFLTRAEFLSFARACGSNDFNDLARAEVACIIDV